MTKRKYAKKIRVNFFPEFFIMIKIVIKKIGSKVILGPKVFSGPKLIPDKTYSGPNIFLDLGSIIFSVPIFSLGLKSVGPKCIIII